MSGVNGLQRAVLWALGLLERYRFIKFGIVGASGVVVNLTVLYLGVPFFLQGWHSNETSSNAGGLILWPVYALMPLGFGLLMLQGLSEMIKRVAFLMGRIDDPTKKTDTKT